MEIYTYKKGRINKREFRYRYFIDRKTKNDSDGNIYVQKG